MIVITGYSHKLDGFLFISEKDTEEEAIKDLLSKRPGYEYVVVEDEQDGPVDVIKAVGHDLDMEDGAPRWGAWAIHVGHVKDGLAPDAVCW